MMVMKNAVMSLKTGSNWSIAEDSLSLMTSLFSFFRLWSMSSESISGKTRHQLSMMVSNRPWLLMRMLSSSGQWLVLTGRKLVHQHFSRWLSINGWKSAACPMRVLGLNNTKLLKRKLHRNPKVFRNSYFLDQNRHQWTLLKKLNYYCVHITLA